MNKNRFRFPYVLADEKNGKFEGVAGLQLESILKRELMYGRKNEALHDVDKRDIEEKMQKERENFIQALSDWPGNFCLELHIASAPNLACRPRGRIFITIFIKAVGDSKEKVKEIIITRYLALLPVINAHIPEAEFSPVVDKRELQERLEPFKTEYGLSVERRKEKIYLGDPLKCVSIGFGKQIKTNIVTEKDCFVNYCFPWIPSEDDWSKLSVTLMGLMDPVKIIIRLATKKSDKKEPKLFTEAINTCERFLSSGKAGKGILNKQAELLRDTCLSRMAQLKEHRFIMGVYIVSTCKLDQTIANVVGKAVTGSETAYDINKLFTGGFKTRKINAGKISDYKYFSEKRLFTLSEAACAFRLPSPPTEGITGLPVKRSRTSLAQLPDRDEIYSVELFTNKHQGLEQSVTACTNERMRHCFIIGQSGCGKSNLMEYMILQDIRAGRGLAVIDPHGDMIDSILDRIPAERAEDVILFDLLDRKRPLGFNIFEWKTFEERDLIIDELYMSIDHLYDMKSTGGPIFESNFRGMLKLLLGDKPRPGFIPTMMEFTLCYQSKDFRQWLQKGIEDPQTLDFIKELEKIGGDARIENLSPYITSKFSRFINDTNLKRIVGQGKTSFNFEDIMNNSKIFLVKLGQGRFGSSVSALLSNQLISRFKLAAMKRGEVAPGKRKDFFLYIDEAQTIPAENLMSMLSEMRKYRLGLILATQYAAQIGTETPGRNNLLAAVLGNVGAMISFRLGYDDAVKLGQVFYPYFSSSDIINLPNWHGYASIQMDNHAAMPFSFQTLRDETPADNKLAKQIITHSRLKYGLPGRAIDKQLNKRRNAWKNE